MLRTKPRLRIGGQGPHLRVRQRGDWASNASASLSEACRASVAIEKALVESIVRARVDGMSWNKIGQLLGATSRADSKDQLIDALADNRRAVLQHLLRETS